MLELTGQNVHLEHAGKGSFLGDTDELVLFRWVCVQGSFGCVCVFHHNSTHFHPAMVWPTGTTPQAFPTLALASSGLLLTHKVHQPSVISFRAISYREPFLHLCEPVTLDQHLSCGMCLVPLSDSQDGC